MYAGTQETEQWAATQIRAFLKCSCGQGSMAQQASSASAKEARGRTDIAFLDSSGEFSHCMLHAKPWSLLLDPSVCSRPIARSFFREPVPHCRDHSPAAPSWRRMLGEFVQKDCDCPNHMVCLPFDYNPQTLIVREIRDFGSNYWKAKHP